MYHITSRLAKATRSGWQNRAWIRPYIGPLLWLLMLVALTAWNFGTVSWLTEHYKGISLRYDAPSISIADIDKIQKKEMDSNREIPDITAWNHEKTGRVNGTLHDAGCDAEIYRVYGEAAEVYPFSELDGSCPDRNDGDGCMISSGISEKLYGNSTCTGNTIDFEKKKYIIRGVFEDAGYILILPDNSRKTRFRNLEIAFPSGYDDMSMELLLARANLLDTGMLCYGGLHSEVLSYLVMLPLWLVVMFLFVWAMRFIWRSTGAGEGRLRKLAYCAVLVFIMVGMLYMLGFRFYLPDRLIPNKWSDFNFFKARFSELAIYLKKLIYITSDVKDYLLLKKTIISAVLGISSMISAAAFFARLRHVVINRNNSLKVGANL